MAAVVDFCLLIIVHIALLPFVAGAVQIKGDIGYPNANNHISFRTEIFPVQWFSPAEYTLRTDRCQVAVCNAKNQQSILKSYQGGAYGSSKFVDYLQKNCWFPVAQQKTPSEFVFAKDLDTKRALTVFYHFNVAADFFPITLNKQITLVTFSAIGRGGPLTSVVGGYTLLPKGPKGRSSYWDKTAIYHEAAHIYWHQEMHKTQNYFNNYMADAVQEGVCDFFACVIAYDSHAASCPVGSYYKNKKRGVRQHMYKRPANPSTLQPPLEHTFKHLEAVYVKEKNDYDKIEKHDAGEVIGNVLWNLAHPAVLTQNGAVDAVKHAMHNLANTFRTTKRRISTPQTFLAFRDCLLAYVKTLNDPAKWSSTTMVFAKHGLGSDAEEDVDKQRVLKHGVSSHFQAPMEGQDAGYGFCVLG